ncbi:MAG: YceD family protein [Chthoniobacterales bacterium]
MKIHLNQIRPEGLHLQGEEDCPLHDLAEVRCAGPLRYSLDLGVSDGALWAQGTIAQPVELNCVACLENFQHEVTVPGFALHTELHGPETIDITPFLREDILLNLPAHPHCDRDGGRVCKGPKLAMTNPAASPEKVEAEKRQRDWEALDKLKLLK